MILLDTNVVSELMKQTPNLSVIRWIDKQPGYRLYISSVTKAEIELGIAMLPEGRRKQGLQEGGVRMFGEFHGRCLPFDELAASQYATLVSTRIRAGSPISVEDAQIAAMALASGFILATRNTNDFEGINGLSVLNPWSDVPNP